MSRKRKLPVALLTLAFLLIVGCIALWLSAGAIARTVIVEAAKANGVELETHGIGVRWGRVELHDAHVRFEGIPGMEANVARADVVFNGFSPSHVEIQSLSASLVGSPTMYVVFAGLWMTRYADALRFPVSAEGLNVTWRESVAEPPWLVVHDGAIEPFEGGSKISAEKALVLGVPIGPVGAMWNADQTVAALCFGDTDPTRALLRVDVDRVQYKASVTLKQGQLSALATPLGVELPVGHNVLVEGAAELSLGAGGTGEITGAVSMKLTNYVPPHPRELEGIVFGTTTVFETGIRLSEDRRTVTLEKTRVSAGAFTLEGQGSISRKSNEDMHSVVRLNMAGSIPCSALAKSAAVAYLGAAGWLLGDIAKAGLAGAVRVSVNIVADTDSLRSAKVDQSVDIGCSIRLF